MTDHSGKMASPASGVAPKKQQSSPKKQQLSAALRANLRRRKAPQSTQNAGVEGED